MRHHVTILAAVSAALLGSTAVKAADLMLEELVVEEAASTFVLTIGAGVVGYNLPDFEGTAVSLDGPLDLGVDNFTLGGLIGVNMSTQLGEENGVVSSLGVSAFASFASSNSTVTQELGNDDGLFIPGITTPTGVIALAVDDANATGSAGISGTTTVPDTVDQIASVPANAAGAVNTYDVSEDDDGFSYAGVGTYAGLPENLAFAFGAIASEEGGVFVAIGDLEGWEVETDVTRDLLYAGGDITFALSGAKDGGEMTVTGYAGPSYRFLGQRIGTDITVDVGELQPTNPVDFAFPLYTQSTVEDLATHYMGGIVGGSISIPVGDASGLTLGIEGGLYYTATSYDATETYSVTGGVPLAVDATVENAIEVGGDDDDFAYALRGQATYTTAISETMQFSLGLGGEYLSQVATVGRDYDAVTTGLTGDAAATTYTGPNADTGSFISYGDMWSVTLTGSVTGQF